MIEAIIVLSLAVAAVYLLRPLFVAAVVFVLLSSLPAAAAAPGQDVAVGLLLIAVDARVDHLRVSEALRIANPGPRRILSLRLELPPGARYLTVHRGLKRSAMQSGGVTDPLLLSDEITLPRGVTEVVYSYALPAGREAGLRRAFPLPVGRMEIVVRGRGVHLSVSRGGAVAPLIVGGQAVPRWEVQGLRPGESVTLALRGLPVSRPWVPRAAAVLFAAALAGGFLVAAQRPGPHPRRVEE